MTTVTRILRDAGLVDDRWYTEHSREKGHAVHLACQFIAEGDLDWTSVDPEIVLRVRAYEAFLKEAKPKILDTEFEVQHPLWGYKGHPDVLCELNGRRALVDIKPPTFDPVYALQLAGYALAMSETDIARFTLHLADNGRPKLEPHKDRKDFGNFMAAMQVAAWRNANGRNNGSR